MLFDYAKHQKLWYLVAVCIEEATKAGGFPSKRTFIAKCKRAYGITPFQLLKQQQSGNAPLMNLNFK